MNGIYNFIPETNRNSRVYNFVAILYLQFVVHVMLLNMLNGSFYISILLLYSTLFTGLFFPFLLFNQQWSPPLTLHASHCSTFCIVCDGSCMAAFCTESIECFPGTNSNFLASSSTSSSTYYYYCCCFCCCLGNRKLDWDRECCRPKGEEEEKKKMSMTKKIRGGAKERNVRWRKGLRAAEIVWEGHLGKTACLF